MMKKMRGIVLVALIVFGAMLQAEYGHALLGQHELVTCGDCHTPVSGVGFAGALFDQTPNCLVGGCHAQQLAEADGSKLFNYSTGGDSGTSHAWGVPYGSIGAGAGGPSTTEQSSWAPRGILGCSSCHWSHYAMDNLTGLSTNSLLKRDNSADQLCLDCHRSRDISDASTLQAGKQMSHPVGVQIPADSAHNSPPLDPYGIPGSVLKLVGAGSDTVSCSTCHGVHFADSNPYTDAIMGQVSSVANGQGMLLRRYNDAQLCKDCHYYQQHGPIGTPAKWQDCRNCHSPHSVGSNKRLVRFDNLSTPFGNRTAIFDSLTSQLVYRPDGKYGICDVCHEIATTFVTWSSGHQAKGINKSEAWKSNCIACHAHAEGDGSSVGSFAAGGAAACGTCHGYPPTGNDVFPTSPTGWATGYDGEASFMNESTVGKHKIHAVTYPYASSGSYGTGACKACHSYPDETTHQDSTYQDVVFGLYSWSSGVWGTYNTGNYECSNVYCHSDGAPNDVIGGPQVTADWDYGTSLTCSGCHLGTPTTSSHTPHAVGDYNLGCENCHATTVSDSTTISDTNVHVNRVRDVAFGGISAAGSYSSPTCNNAYCHGNFPNGNGDTTPTWGGAGPLACTTCHNMPPIAPLTTHDKHTNAAQYDYDCAYCHDDQMIWGDDTALDNHTGHVDGTKSVAFYSDGSRTNGAGVYTGGKCQDIYCHSAGTDTLAANFFVNESTVWSSAVTTCKSCHGDSALGGWTSAMPNYANGLNGKENSHDAHVRNNGYDCNICHDTIVGADNASISDMANHVDGNYDVDFAPAYAGASYNTGTQVCSTVSCHGNNDVTWGAVVGCQDCHTTAGADVDEYGNFGNSTPALINTTQWTNEGHGKLGKVCTDCHDSGASHGDAVNPFRVLETPDNPDSLCNKAGCHIAGDTEFTHSQAVTGGTYTFTMKCIDCHDPHGDDNIFMMHSTIPMPDSGDSYQASDTYGIPKATKRNVDFTANATAGDYATATATDGISKVCNVCHSNTIYRNPDDSSKWRYQQDMVAAPTVDQHYTSNRCISCHAHKNGMKGVSCAGCHGMPPGNLIDDAGQTSGSVTAGAHTAHTAKYTAGTNCELCHDDGMNDTGNPFNAKIDMDFSSTLGHYTTGLYYGQNIVVTNNVYPYIGAGDGGADNTLRCESVKCHGTSIAADIAGSDSTPNWNTPATGACGTCHDATKATMIVAGSHNTHANVNDINCQYCHASDAAATHVDSFIDFNDANTSMAATTVCANCHADAAGAKTDWPGATPQTCVECHETTAADTDDFTFTFYTSGTMAQARVNDTDWTTRGHGRTTAYPVSGNQGASFSCTDCHDTAKNHQTGASYFRLKGTDDPDTLCLDCHGSGAQINALGLRAAAPVLSNVTGYQGHTWANLNAAGYTNLTTWHFVPKCIDCHDPHGDGNIFMMHSKVADEGSDGMGVPANFPNNSTVNFTAVAGADSYDDGGAGTQSLCVVCHDRTAHNGSDGTHSSYGSTDCRGCHDHKLGFTPSGCDGCHAAVPPDSPSTWTSDKAASPATVGLHTPHANNPDNRPGIPAGTGYTCDVCHSSDPGGDAAHNTAKSDATLANMTGNGMGTVGVLALNAVGMTSVVDDTCASVTCHGERTWTRAWAKPADCNDCHGDKSGGGSQITTGSHEKHTSPTFSDYACTDCHIDNLNNYSTHYDSVVDMNATLTTGYARGTGFETYTTGNEYSTCSVTCHGSGIVDLSMQPTTPPKWADSLTAECGDCHIATGATVTIAGSHKNHANLRAIPCGTCHAPDTASTHVDGFVNFTSGNLLAATGVCDQCHGASSPDAKDDWPTATTQTCDECHVGAGDVKNYVYGDATMAVIDDTQWTTTGHGRTNATTYTLSTNNGANKGCGDCHDYLVLHDDGTNPFRLLNDDTNTLCLGCHDGTGPGESVLDPSNHHISITNLAGRASWPFEPKCVDCHDPHGDDNLSMIRSQVNTPTTASNYITGGGSNAFGIPTSGGTLTAVSFLNRDGMAANSYATGTGTGICEICHSNAVTIPVDWYNRQGDGNATDHAGNGGAPCEGCHSHNSGFQGGGESSGAQACGGCHSSLFDNMTAQSSYHHYMDNADATYGSDNLDPLETPDPATRNCLMCHVDHDIFRPDLNAGFGTRAANLRQDATTTAIGQGDANDLINTDFWPAKSTGIYAATDPVSGQAGKNGVCMSCHDSATNASLTKNVSNRGAGDGSTKARGVSLALYTTSSHNYQIMSSMNNYVDGSSFRANCSKCHGSYAFNKPTAQTGEKFGLHDSKYQSLLRDADGSPAAPLADELCYSCHSKDDRASGGPGDTYDYYSSVVMNSGSKLIKTAVKAKTYSHPTGATTNHDPAEYYAAPDSGTAGWNSDGIGNRHVECVDCHNTHGGNAAIVRVVGSATGNSVAGSQKGVWGVDMTYPVDPYNPAEFGQQPTFAKVDEASTQAGVCIKCHSGYGYGASIPTVPSGAPDPAGVTAGATAGGIYDTLIPTGTQTDQSREFNPNNPGYHPVLAVGRNQPPKNSNGNWPNSGNAMPADKQYYNVYTQMTGFYNFSGLGYTFVPPWSNTSLMACTDCHAADNQGLAISSVAAVSTTTQGSWNTDVAGGTLGDNDATFATSNGTTQMEVDISGVAWGGNAQTVELALYVNNTIVKNADFSIDVLKSDVTVFAAAEVLRTQITGGAFLRFSLDITAEMTTAGCLDATCINDLITVKVAAPAADYQLTKVAVEAYYDFTEKLRGPHGSLNRWILETANRDITFQDPATGSWVTPNSDIVAGSTEEKVFCYNCHSRDVYGIEGGNIPTNILWSRANHPNLGNAAHTTPDNVWGIFCMNCHGGRGPTSDAGVDDDLIGGIHGIYATTTAFGDPWGFTGTFPYKVMNRPLGVRLLYGATMIGAADETTVYCYTNVGADATGSCTSEPGSAAGAYSDGAGNSDPLNYTYTGW